MGRNSCSSSHNACADEDRRKRALTGSSDLAERNEILLPDRQSAELGAAATDFRKRSCSSKNYVMPGVRRA
jgi:hypothetical protein